MWVFLRLAALAAFIWTFVHGPLAAVVVSGTFAIVLEVREIIADPASFKGTLPGILGLLAGMAACWGTGFLLVYLIGSGEPVSVGPGFDRLNLPGTLLGGVIWIAAIWWGIKRRRSSPKN